MRMELDVQDHRFEEILSDPELTGNRRVGSTFVNSLFRPVPSPGKLVTSPHVRNRVAAGFAGDGFPLSVQIVGPPDGEGVLLSLAAQLEQARDWPAHRPAAAA